MILIQKRFKAKRNHPLNKKSAPTKVNAPKTQTPIVAKQNQINGNEKNHILSVGICIFTNSKNNIWQQTVSP